MIEDIKKLRQETGFSVSLCKSALEEAGGNREKALNILKGKGAAATAKKADRELKAGTIGSYVYNTKNIGAMVNLRCETDFVAQNGEFQGLARDIAMHISAINPEDLAKLMSEAFVKDESKTIKDLIEAATQKFGERIEVAQFARFSTQ